MRGASEFIDAGDEGGAVDRFGGDGEAPEDGLGEGLGDSKLLGRILGLVRSKRMMRPLETWPRSGPRSLEPVP